MVSRQPLVLPLLYLFASLEQFTPNSFLYCLISLTVLGAGLDLITRFLQAKSFIDYELPQVRYLLGKQGIQVVAQAQGR